MSRDAPQGYKLCVGYIIRLLVPCTCIECSFAAKSAHLRSRRLDGTSTQKLGLVLVTTLWGPSVAVRFRYLYNARPFRTETYRAAVS